MPDGDWYQIDTPLRSMVFADYNEDAAEEGSELKHCKSKCYFYDTWNANFPEIRLRKWCRFAKCDFCVDWRRLSQDHSRKAEAQERLKVHRAWANVRERGLFHKKQEKAKRKPREYISISIDGMCVRVTVCVFSFRFPFPVYSPFLVFFFVVYQKPACFEDCTDASFLHAYKRHGQVPAWLSALLGELQRRQHLRGPLGDPH